MAAGEGILARLSRLSIKKANSNSFDLKDGGAATQQQWHSLSSEDALAALQVDASQGLSDDEAAARLLKYGPNALTPPRKKTFLERLWEQLNNVVIFVLFCAAVVEGALQSWPEFGMVVGVIAINTAIGMVQEGRAEKAADAIKAMLSPTARVKRGAGGAQRVVPATQLVPGDIVVIKSGDKIPADLRLLSTANLQVQEAMLTGESVPVSKMLAPVAPNAPLGDRKCLAFSATTVVSGQGEGVVVATGDAAEIGRINAMVSTVEAVHNNLMHQMTVFGRWLALLVAAIALTAFLLARFRSDQGWQESFESAVSIAVAIIPEGLPAMVTIVLAVGTTVMARNNAIIRQLPAVETLGSLNVICSDKTGTLTKNEMTVVAVHTAAGAYRFTGVGYDPAGRALAGDGDGGDGDKEGAEADLPEAELAALRALLEGALLCNDSALARAVDKGSGREVWQPLGAPTEAALLTAGEKVGLSLGVLKAAHARVASVPFESEHKFMATAHEYGGAGGAGGGGGGKRTVLFVKGAPERLLPLCKDQAAAGSGGGAGGDALAPAPLDEALWRGAQERLSGRGLRTLALCRAELAEGEDPAAALASPAAILGRGRALTMLVLVGILDPPRDEAVAAVREAHRAGINVKMITGDHALTALSIGRMLGIAPPAPPRAADRAAAPASAHGQHGHGAAIPGVLTGPEVDAMTDAELEAAAPACNVFARASPENKLRIVRALQARRKVVAMTGDGVNDAPALKAADVGVAMGITGTDVSKEAAKMILADDNFATIIAAVKEGRRVWDNIRKLILFNMPVNLAQGTSVMYAYVLGFEHAPLVALQVLLVNLVTAVTLGLALAAEPAEPTVMDKPPRRHGKRLIGKLIAWRMFAVAHLIDVFVLLAFWLGKVGGHSLASRRAESFNVLVGCQVSYFVTCRFIKLSTVNVRVLKGNNLAYAAVGFIFALMAFVTYVPGVNGFFHMAPMDGIQWARVVVAMVATYVIVEAEKALVDPVLMPALRPVLAWLDARAPRCLSYDAAPPRPWHRALPRVVACCAAPPAVVGDAAGPPAAAA